MKAIQQIRLQSQQLGSPDFSTPKDLVSWMGAVQAQDYGMTKWAVGVRLKSASMSNVEVALNKGEILRTHVMRPTWHLVAAEDIRWMLQLSKESIKSSAVSRDRDLEMTEDLYAKCNDLIIKILTGNTHLTKTEIGVELSKVGIVVDTTRNGILISRMNLFMMRAEVEGVVCSGIVKGNKHTYALLDERVPPVKALLKDEALAKLATNYFRSHSPAGLQDFVWWSGMSVANARQAVHNIRQELIEDQFAEQKLFVHRSCGEKRKSNGHVLHFLPSFDEYLISYKDRTSVLDLEHHPKAFTKNGIFHPVIIYDGKVVGTWKKTVKKGLPDVESVFFEQIDATKEQTELAANKYKEFLNLNERALVTENDLYYHLKNSLL